MFLTVWLSLGEAILASSYPLGDSVYTGARTLKKIISEYMTKISIKSVFPKSFVFRLAIISFHFNSFKEGCPSARADLQGALYLKT